MKKAWKIITKSNRKTALTTTLTFNAPSNTTGPDINVQPVNRQAEILIPALQGTHPSSSVSQTLGVEGYSGNSAVTPIVSPQGDFETIVTGSEARHSIHTPESISQNPVSP